MMMTLPAVYRSRDDKGVIWPHKGGGSAMFGVRCGDHECVMHYRVSALGWWPVEKSEHDWLASLMRLDRQTHSLEDRLEYSLDIGRQVVGVLRGIGDMYEICFGDAIADLEDCMDCARLELRGDALAKWADVTEDNYLRKYARDTMREEDEEK